MPFLAGAAAVGVLGLARRRAMSKRLEEVLRAAERLAGGDPTARLPPGPADAIGRVAATLNLLAERFAHDIAELKRLEEVRKEFVANVSHELRTPLASIKAFAETLSGGPVEESERAEFLSEIERAADRMTRLIDDILQLSALESGKMPPSFEPLELLPVVGEVVAALKPLAGKKQIVLRVEPFGDLARVMADRQQLKQVLTNLLDNAIKYTPEKGLVRVGAAQEGARIAVSVADNGPGIPAADLPRVFERFYRVDKARSRELGGTGLGLSIVKHIVELHGGTVRAESEPGQGATFRVYLPAV